MFNDNQEENLYTIISNLLQEVDQLFRNQIGLAGNIHYWIHNTHEEMPELEKRQLIENCDTIQNQFQAFREDVVSANKCLRLLGLPEIDLKWVVVLDETKPPEDNNDKTKVQ